MVWEKTNLHQECGCILHWYGCVFVCVCVCVIVFATVGYIVGLGDRHVQNILIDTNSAELIHIDLGKLHPNHTHPRE